MANLPYSLASVLLVVMAIHISSNTVSTTTDGELLVDPRSMVKYPMPDSCVGQTYCFEKGDHYPDHVMQNLNLTFKLKKPIGRRQGDDIDHPDCPTDSNDAPIYYIVDENEAVRVVVQVPDKFTQRYNVKWCQNEGKIVGQTEHLPLSMVNRFNVECVSEKLKLNFVVLSRNNNNKIEIAKAKIPVCCKCRYDIKPRN